MAETVIKDKAELLSKITKTTAALKKADPKLLKSKKFIKEAVAVNPKAITFADDELLFDFSFLESLITEYPAVYRHLPTNRRNIPELTLAAVCASTENIPYVSATAKKNISPWRLSRKYKKNRNFVMFLASSPETLNGEYIKGFADDKEIILAAVTSSQWAYPWASDRLKADIDVLRAVYVSGNGWLCREAEPYRKDIICDRDTVIKAMENSPYFLIEPEYAEDVEVVSIAIKNYPSEYKTLSEKMRDNEYVTETAVTEDGKVLQYASERLRDNDRLAELALRSSRTSFKYLSERLRDNVKLVEMAIVNEASNFQFASDRIRDDKGIVKSLLPINEYILEYAAESVRNDKDLITLVIEDNTQILRYVSDTIRRDKEFIKSLFAKETFVVRFMHEELRTDADFLLELLADCKADGDFCMLTYLPEEMQDNEEIVAACVAISLDEFDAASERLQYDAGFALTLLMTVDIELYDYLPDEVQADKEIKDYMRKQDLKEKLGL